MRLLMDSIDFVATIILVLMLAALTVVGAVFAIPVALVFWIYSIWPAKRSR